MSELTSCDTAKRTNSPLLQGRGMGLMALCIGAFMLVGCASNAWQKESSLTTVGMAERWTRCIDKAAYDWFDEENDAVADEVKRLRGTLSYGQAFVRSLNSCRDELSSKDLQPWDQLSDREVSQFIRKAQKQFDQVRADIQMQRTLQEI